MYLNITYQRVIQFVYGIVLLLHATLLTGQNYIEYQKTMNRVDQDMLNNQVELAKERLDSIHQNYSFIYAVHCIKSLQICCATNDSLRANTWLTRCFTQGVPLWIIRTNGLTQKALSYSTTRFTLARVDSLHGVYLSKIDLNLAKRIDSMYIIDQEVTGKLNNGCLLCFFKWKKNNARHFSFIQHITDSLGFPGERLIGLPPYYNDSAKAAENLIFYGPYISDHRAKLMVIHYLSSRRKPLDHIFYTNIETGYLPANNFGAFNDFSARWGNRKKNKDLFYNVWHYDSHAENIPRINARRLRIGLNLFEAQEKNVLINRDRRKNKLANLEVITE
jgi:hypothetical protein